MIKERDQNQATKIKERVLFEGNSEAMTALFFLSYTSEQFPFLTFNFVWGRRSVNTALQQVSKMDEGYDLLKIIFTTQHLLFFLRFRLFGRIKIYKCTYSLSVHLAKNAILYRLFNPTPVGLLSYQLL